MNRRTAGLLIAGAVALALVLGLGWWWLERGGAGGRGGDADGGEGEPMVVSLYFPGDDGFLYREERSLVAPATGSGRAGAVVRALLEGPRTGGLIRPFPEEVELLGAYLGGDGTAFVDLGGAELERPPTGGSLQEMMMVYSVVDSLVYNLDDVRRVVLLWNGEQRETFAGHLDTSRPLAANDELLAPGARTAGVDAAGAAP